MKPEVNKWLEQVERVKQEGVDLSRDEDLSIAIMNLVSLEEHFYFSAMKTNNKKYVAMLDAVRNVRKNMLAKIVKNPQGEEWCVSKHLLAASMRLIEVGTKELAKKNHAQADEFFSSAFDLYSLFFAINTGVVKSQGLSKEEKEAIEPVEKTPLFKKVTDFVKHAVDCCRE
ncbi:hypothetical protein COT72_00205 [archaeon CG10_big_fil_rev_8_21_14_0_10_43_11]|nr:MAG: hypothetical protein COT72_00205 [archaeon CG10_big_fil_rev_8_21_14_0_10_43_11]